MMRHKIAVTDVTKLTGTIRRLRKALFFYFGPIFGSEHNRCESGFPKLGKHKAKTFGLLSQQEYILAREALGSSRAFPPAKSRSANSELPI